MFFNKGWTADAVWPFLYTKCKVLLCICFCMRVKTPRFLVRFAEKITTVAVSGFWAAQEVFGVDKVVKMTDGSAKVTDISKITVSASVLGNLFGVTDRRIRQMAEEGILERAAKGRYKLVDSLKNYILTLKLSAEGTGIDNPDGEIDINEEKALHERVKRHISELKLRTMKGELHKSADVERVMTDMLAAFRTRILSIPSKVAPVLEFRDANDIKERLLAECTEALSELKDYDPKAFYPEEYVGDGDDA